MKVLYCGMKYDYGDPGRGLSFEHTNLYDTLLHMGFDVAAFDYMENRAVRAVGDEPSATRGGGRRQAGSAVRRPLHRPVRCGTIRSISDRGETVTFNWFCDDHWRFDGYSRHWAPEFRWVSTTDSQAVAKYAALGYTNVIETQWACNHFLYRPGRAGHAGTSASSVSRTARGLGLSLRSVGPASASIAGDTGGPRAARRRTR